MEMETRGPEPRPRAEILGVGVSAITMREATDTIEAWIANETPHYVCITGVHGIMESQRDSALRDIHNAAGLVTPDGMPLVWMSRWLGQWHVERVYGPDLMLELSAISARRGYRNFYFGGGPGTADRLRDALTHRHPGLRVTGTLSPPFRPVTAEEDAEMIRAIDASGADIVWVGLSTPKQERWMASHVGRLKAPVLIGVGAAFDFLAGEKAQAPLWMQRRSMEWLFRLASEPRRLAPRYLRNNPSFVLKAARQLAGKAARQLAGLPL